MTKKTTHLYNTRNMFLMAELWPKMYTVQLAFEYIVSCDRWVWLWLIHAQIQRKLNVKMYIKMSKIKSKC